MPVAVAHARQAAPVAPSSGARAKPLPRAGHLRRISEARLSARAQDALDLQEAISVAGTSIRAVAAHLGINEAVVRDWLSVEVSTSPAAGDIDALPGKVRAAYAAIKRGRRAPRSLVPRSAEQLAGDVTIAAGDLARAVRCGDESAIDRAALALDDASLALVQRRRVA